MKLSKIVEVIETETKKYIDQKLINRFFWVLLAGLYVSMAFLFCAQAFCFKNLYSSDFEVHLFNGIHSGGSGYSLESTLIFLIYRITGNNKDASMVIFSLLLAFMVLLTSLAVASLHSFLDSIESGTSLGVLRNRFVGLFSLIIAPLAIPFVWFWFYSFNYNINAWHNSTYMEMRLFSIIALCFYFVIQSSLRNGKGIRPSHWLAMTASLFASTWFKPSFFVGFAPVMAIWLLIDLFRSHWDLKKIRDLFLFGCTCIPAGLMVIMQYWKLYGSREDISVVIAGKRNEFMTLFVVALFLIIPVIIFIYNRKKMVLEYKNGNRAYAQIAALWLFEKLYSTVFTEKGRTGGNFGWGVRIGNYLIVILFARLFWINLLDVRKKRKQGQKITKTELIYIIGIGACFLWEICCGLYYYAWILSGRTYQI